MDLIALHSKFSEIFGPHESVRTFFAPARVNLIGEHTDYNGGHVFPCALTFGTYCLCAPRKDTRVRLFSLNFPDKGLITAELTALAPHPEQDWANYPLGVLAVLQKHGYPLPHGFDFLFFGDVPNGAGLSSSASIELATAVAVNETLGLSVARIPLVQICQEAENKFVGMNCGIMDQFASGMGKENHAILLDCNTLAYEHVPLNLRGVCILIINSHKKHSLVTSAYNDRRRESEAALRALQKQLPVKSLGELSIAQFEQYKHLISDPVALKRGKHAVYENQRTLQAASALKQGDLAAFGKLMNASHISLRDDYQTSCAELDLIAQTAWQMPAVLGARITGGGFGGCAVALVREDGLAEVKKQIAAVYLAQTGIEAGFYQASAGGPAREILP